MNEKERKINNILSEWNPLGVDSIVSKDEYQEYIPSIIDSMDDCNKLKCCIECIIEIMGIDRTLECVKTDIDNICKSIYNIYSEYNND